MFLEDLGVFGVKIGDGKESMAKNRKIYDFCTTCALRTTVPIGRTTVRVPTAYF